MTTSRPRPAAVLRLLTVPALLGSLAASAAAPPPRRTAPQKTAAPSPEPIYDKYVVGEKAIQKAAQACQDSGRRLLVNFGTNECEACRVVNDAIYEKPFVKGFMEQFIPLFVDVSPGSVNEGLLAKYGIDPKKGFPAVVISAKDLQVAEVTRSGELVAVAKQGKEAVQGWLLARFFATEEK